MITSYIILLYGATVIHDFVYVSKTVTTNQHSTIIHLVTARIAQYTTPCSQHIKTDLEHLVDTISSLSSPCCLNENASEPGSHILI